MNPTSEQPARSSFSCDRHPAEAFTGFCPSCLCERLTTLDQSAASSSRRNSSSSAIRALFKPSVMPELRRTKSFSGAAGLGVAACEPQRRSCDVRHTLWSLFSIHDGDVIKEAEITTSREAEGGDVRPVKELLAECSSKRMTSSRSNFWSAASVLGNKWRKWRRKQKASSKLPVEKPMSRQYRETQSEIADYGFGRRSCDTDPRFSFDEPRASWDGYFIGRLPPMVEDVPRSDMQIPVEEEPRVVDLPGGSIQTRDYYLDSSSSKRRKSLDRSNSIRKMPAAAAVVAELDETQVKPPGAVSNSKLSPTNEPPRVSNSNSNSNSLRDDCSDTFELGFRGLLAGEKKQIKKPGRRWKWKLWGLIHRRGKEEEEDDDDEDRRSSVSGVGRSYSESCQHGTNGMNRNVFRSNSSASMRSSSSRKTNAHGHGHMNGKLFGNDQVFERNRSARYSPNHIDNGLLRFYLAPLTAPPRGGIGIATGKSRGSSNHSHSIARSMLY